MNPALLEQIVDIVEDLGDEEGGVILVLAHRILAGQRAYGKLDLANDPRDWRKERAEELADAFIYDGFLMLAEAIRRMKEDAH
jgi:hypothetical protein